MRRKNLRWLRGYDNELETEHDEYFDLFWLSDDPDERRVAMRGVASLTALRSATFISAHERSLGIPDE